VKPENLFLTALGGEHDFVKVIDFGIAKVRTVDGKMTDTGSLLGTPAYMSPEMAMGLTADARSDVYALGAVLYFLLCGKPPFEAESAGGLIFAHVNQAVTPPSQNLGRSLPGDVEAVALRALAKDPNERYENAAALALALAACTLAGKWTFGDATTVARRSSRPPPPGGMMEALPSLRAPRVPQFEQADLRESSPEAQSGTNVIAAERGSALASQR
jgi:serine/threonine-protein kinase